jgi:nitrate reductase delta subunit
MNAKTYKALGALLDYPQPELVAAMDEIERALREEALVDRHALDALRPLLDELRTGDLMALQERYVGLFDRVRSLSLHLFEHVHGESRDRGQAMVDLRALYARHGYELTGEELPDYLPAFLEFLSRVSPDEARGLLGETRHLLEAVGARLVKRDSSYAAVLLALLALAGGDTVTLAAVPDADIRAEDDPAALDATWQEAPAFGPSSGCGTTGTTSSTHTAPVKFYKGVAAWIPSTASSSASIPTLPSPSF